MTGSSHVDFRAGGPAVLPNIVGDDVGGRALADGVGSGKDRRSLTQTGPSIKTEFMVGGSLGEEKGCRACAGNDA